MSERYTLGIGYIHHDGALADKIRDQESSIKEAGTVLALRNGVPVLKNSVAEYRRRLRNMAGGTCSIENCTFGSLSTGLPLTIYNMVPGAGPEIIRENVRRFRMDSTWHLKRLEEKYRGVPTSDIEAEIERGRKTIEELEKERASDKAYYDGQMQL